MRECDKIVDWKRLFSYGFLRREAVVSEKELFKKKRKEYLRKSFVGLNKVCDYWIGKYPILKALNESLHEWTTTDVDLVDMLTTTGHANVETATRAVYNLLWGLASHAYGTERYREIMLSEELVEDSLAYAAGAAVILRHVLYSLAYSARLFVRDNWRVHKHSFEATIWTWLDDRFVRSRRLLPYGSVTRTDLRYAFMTEMNALVLMIFDAISFAQSTKSKEKTAYVED